MPISSPEPLEAGRALDVLVATRVMGLSVRRGLVRLPYYEMETEVLEVDEDPMEGMAHEEDYIADNRIVPHFNTQITAAFSVLDLFDEVDLHKGAHGWLCRLERSTEGAVQHGEAIRAETASLAICAAALAAVGAPT